MKKSLHLTHTDIESDSRILKEMGSLAGAGYAIRGIGVVLEEGAQKSVAPFKASISAIRLKSRKLTFLPRTVRHALSLCELAAKMLPRSILHWPDIIHCHDTLVLPLGVIVKLVTGARLVYDAHELESDRNGLTRFQGRLTLGIEKLLWRFIDALIVVSPSIETWYQRNNGAKSTAVILNSPLLSPHAIRDSDYLRNKYSIPSGTAIFIYVGILAPGRGLDVITQVFSLPGILSHVVFLGYGELTDELKQLAIEHANIHLHHAVPHAQVVPIVQSADYGLCLVQNVSLSDYYCLPNKLFEYCFAGIPVLASDFPDIRDVLLEYGIGECCKPEAHDIERAVRGLESQEMRFEFADLQPLSWQEQERKLVALYQQALSPEIH